MGGVEEEEDEGEGVFDNGAFSADEADRDVKLPQIGGKTQ